MTWRALLFFPAVALGVALFWFQTRTGEETGQSAPAAPLPVAVRATTLMAQPLDVVVTGYGRVAPVRSWTAVSQVEGRIVSLGEGLAPGGVFDAGSVIVEIDPRDYEIRVARAEANLAAARAQLQELEAQEANIRAQVALEREVEAFLQSEYSRNAALVERGTLAASTLDQANRELLSQQRKVLDLDNQIALIPVQRISAQATIRTRQVELEEAERDLSRTRITVPFRGRVSAASLSEDEYVRVGQELAVIDDISAAEVVAAVQPEEMTRAVQAMIEVDDALTMLLQGSDTALAVLKRLNFEVHVQQSVGGRVQRWPATLPRFVGVADAQTGTLGIVVQVDDPLRPDVATRRPLLNNGSFVEVIFAGKTPEARISIPRDILRHDAEGTPYVFVSDAAQTLRRRDVVPGVQLGERLIVDAGLGAGDTVLLSVPRPAIIGQSLTLVDGGAE